MSIINIVLQEGMSGSSQLILNSFYYETPTDVTEIAILNGILLDWVAKVLPEIRAIQTTDVDVEKVTAQIVGGALFAELVFAATTGDLAGPTAPQFVAVPFKLIRSTLATRHGQKRFTGIPEANVGRNGDITGAPYYTALDNLDAALMEPLTVVGGSDAVPIIYGRANPEADPPLTERTNPVAAVSHSFFATTQNTRKEGRGA